MDKATSIIQLLLMNCHCPEFDPLGNTLWEKRDKNIFIGIRKIILDERGNLLTTGFYNGDFQLGKATFNQQGYGYKIFVAMFDNQGEGIWSLSSQNGNDDNAVSIARSTQSGDLYICGSLQYNSSPSFGDISLPSDSEWNRAFVLKLGGGTSLEPLRLDLGNDTTLCEGNSFDLHANGFTGYQWQDGSTDTVFHVTSPGEYYVSALDFTGRQQSDTITIKPCFESTIPNVFTPNGDQFNQCFVFEQLDLKLSNALFIYDRWGKKVYSSPAYQNNWDGNGLSPGTYYYELHNAADSKVYSGWVSLFK